MRLLRRIYRILAGKCVECGTRLTDVEVLYDYRNCLHCEARMDGE